ncbi:MAG TPA: CHAD domain-containing protein [Candidatus Baltobacteraceae bacterium]|jgi:CHAD domain-containing protein|nr:CHAD domain-containing protein [Candidatus Baltobacteraceae bacterium]
MGYRIEIGESLAAAFGRIAAEEIDLAAAELRRPNRGEAVHNARKALKRLRALLRSLRVAFPKRFFRAENRRIAAAGRTISPLRDVHVQLRTLGKLKAAASLAGDHVRRQLLRRQSSFIRRIPALRQTVRAMLDVSRQSLASWSLRKATAEDLVAGLKRIYKQGRVTFKTARASPTPAHLHEWRKKSKLLGHGLELIKGLGPAKLSRTIRRSNALTEALGDDHDLFMVLSALNQENKANQASDFRPLARRISLKRVKLQRRAFRLGEKLYGEKPVCFEQRLDRYLRGRKHT